VKIYLLRHGETEENKNKVYYGKLDVGLNEKGKVQAKHAADFLRDVNFSSVYISERRRTRETAEIVLGNSSATFIVDNRINEISFGEFEGKSYEEIKKTFPVECEQWDENWKEFIPPGGESYLKFCNRISSFMQELLRKKEEEVLIVTHGGVIRAMYCYVLNNNIDLYWKFASKNGDVSVLRYEFGNLFIDSITHAAEIDF
jgi:alpha-ribazole phosphatase